MLIGLIVLALVVLGVVVAFAAVLMFWIVMIVFWVTTIVLIFVVQDPYLGFVLAIPVTALIFWGVSWYSEKQPPA